VLTKPLIADWWKWRIFVMLSILAAGCGGSVPREQLIGSYTVDYGYGVERLTLRGDGTYVQEFAAKDEASRPINQGRFNLRVGDYWDGQILELETPVIVDDLGKRSAMARSAGVWPLRIRKTWSGHPKFLINEDMGLEFNRVK
jgi:hypothetical protein